MHNFTPFSVKNYMYYTISWIVYKFVRMYYFFLEGLKETPALSPTQNIEGAHPQSPTPPLPNPFMGESMDHVRWIRD